MRFLCVPHAYVNVNVIAFQQNEHECTPIERQKGRERKRSDGKKSLNKYIMQNERMTIPTKRQKKKQNEFTTTTSAKKNVE